MEICITTCRVRTFTRTAHTSFVFVWRVGFRLDESKIRLILFSSASLSLSLSYRYQKQKEETWEKKEDVVPLPIMRGINAKADSLHATRLVSN